MNKKVNFIISICLIFISMLMLFLKYNYVSISLGIITILITIFIYHKNLRLLLFFIFISISTIFTNILILHDLNKETIDIFKDKNFLLGTLEYGYSGAKYIFNDDYTYINYTTDSTSNNYCTGKYEYSFGAKSNDNKLIYEDKDNYYYTLNLTEDSCIIMNEKLDITEDRKIVVSVNKKDNNYIIFIDSDNNDAYIVNKK